MNKEKYISVEEAAKKWGKTARNVRLRCQKGHVPGATIEGRSWLIPADAVDPGQSTRRKVRAKSIWEVLKAEKRSGTKNGIYHRLQIDFAYNSNHMEGSRLTHEQTRWIFETKTIGSLGEDTPVDDVVETANHFRCLDIVIETAGAALTESYIKRLHAQLKSGTSDSRKAWFAVGEYKRLDNVVGERETCPASEVPRKMAALVRGYAASGKTLEDIIDFHVKFEVKRINELSAITDKIYIWDYPYDYVTTNAIFPILHTLREDMRYYVDHSVKGIFINGQTDASDFDDLKIYLLAKVMFDPYMSAEEYERHMMEFLEGYYGAGWKELYRFILMSEKASAKKQFDRWSPPQKVIPLKYDKDGKVDYTFMNKAWV